MSALAVGRNRGGALAGALVLACVAGGARSQAPAPGQWTQGFDHAVFPAAGATDHLVPFPSPALTTSLFGFVETTPAGAALKFNSAHMSLIPRGKDRGKVIVWNQAKFHLNPLGSYADQGLSWSFQTWSIVDPAVAPTGPRFQNFLLPLHPVLPWPQGGEPILENLFCAGHCWTPYGDLVVVGGDTTGIAGAPAGAAMVMLYRPDEVGQAWPGYDPVAQSLINNFSGPPLYSGAHGKWIYGPRLQQSRYYPTVTMTSRLARTGFVEVALVLGGSGNGIPVPGVNPPENTYEGLQLPAVSASTPLGLVRDFVGPLTNPKYTFEGPDGGAQNRLFDEYPRVHWIGSGQAFVSGEVPLSSKSGHEAPWTVPGSWDISVGSSGPPSSFVTRHDGASVFFARSGPLTNFVARMGGFDGGGSGTATTEFLTNAAGAPGTSWIQGPSMPRARGWQNAVILPDGSILVIGGTTNSAVPPYPSAAFTAWASVAREAALFKDGQWHSVATATTPRGYHASAVLLPDGRVMIGGGEGRHNLGAPSWDYEIYSPWYMTQPRPAITAIEQASSLGSNPDGSVIVQYGEDVTIRLQLPPLVSPGKIVLMAPGSMTHHSDMHARYVELEQIGVDLALETGVADVFCQMPPETLAPRGYYMVFALTSGGVPSPAGWIQIRQ